MYSRDDIASMTDGMGGGSKKKKKKKRKEPTTFMEKVSYYMEDFVDFAQESSSNMREFILDSWQTMKDSVTQMWNGKEEL